MLCVCLNVIKTFCIIMRFFFVSEKRNRGCYLPSPVYELIDHVYKFEIDTSVGFTYTYIDEFAEALTKTNNVIVKRLYCVYVVGFCTEYVR